ncbi:hypothetical protein KBD59_05345, partial [Candidatus Gracilibacteria bacterium]|nr:hypothetical protein [Candidatus Gracilibacteria bacterium]
MAISDNYPRFVFRAPPGGQPPEGSAAAPTPVPTEKSKYGPLLTMAQKIEAEKKEEALKAQRKDLAKTVLTEDVAKKTDALDKHFRENIDETGDAKEYIETFTKDKIRYDQLVGNLKLIMSRAGTDSAANFENWEGMPPTDVAKIFDIENQAGSGADYIPRGKGRLAFVAGLKQATPDSDPTHKNTYEQSDAVVKALVQILHERFEKENRADADLNQEKNKPLLGHTLGDMKKELLRNLQGGSGLDKTMIVGSLALVAWLGYKYRDSDIFFGVKLKDVASIGGG